MATQSGGVRIPPWKELKYFPWESQDEESRAEIESNEVGDQKYRAGIESNEVVEKSEGELETADSEEEDEEEYCGYSSYSSSEDSDLEEEVYGLRMMSKQELREYYKSVEESGGYDVMNFDGVCMMGGILAHSSHYVEKHYEFFKKFADFAIEENNSKENTNYELVKVVKVNFQAVAGTVYYITSEVKVKGDADDGPLRCRARVFEKLNGSLLLRDFRVEPFQ